MNDRVPTRYLLIYILCIACLCGIGFAGLRNHPWSYDDLDHIEKAKSAQENITAIFAPEKTALRLRFVLSFYFYAAYKVFGEEPTGYHILNILLHVLNSLLCARLLLTLFSCPKLAALSGFLFAINTTHYEAIYWVSASAALLGTGFALTTVLFFAKYLISNRKVHLIVASFAYAATIFSYESLGVIFAIILLLWFQHKSKPRFKDIAILLPFLVFAALLFLINEIYYQNLPSNQEIYRPGLHIPYNFAFFVGRLFLNWSFAPFGWEAGAPFDIPRAYFDWYAAAGLIILIGLGYAAYQSKTICFATVWILMTILPYTLWDNYSYFPRYWYCPAIGGATVLAAFLLWFFSIIPLSSRIKFACFSPIIICLTILSLRKMEIYEGYYLWHDANFYQSPNHKKDPKTSIKYYERVLSEYKLKFSLLTNNLGVSYQQVGDLDKALQMYYETIQIDPDYNKGILNYANALFLKHRFSESVQVFSVVAKRNPAHVHHIKKLGIFLYQRGEINAAIQFFRLIVKTDPKNEQNYFILGVLFHTKGKIEDAISAYKQALSINPEHANTRTILESLLANPEMSAPELEFQSQ
ncbi:MAG: tetratricopeptide repeat protein [Gemmatimonadetes bacterium]|nr:tetratricopeptide repeat protein [Gemmatimonadota bacterium]